jgi:hypothetical protein
VRAGTEKGVAGEFVAFLDGFEEEGVVAGVDLVESGDGRFHVGDDLAVNRDEVAAMGPFAETFAGWKKAGVHKRGEIRLRNKPTRGDQRGQSKWEGRQRGILDGGACQDGAGPAPSFKTTKTRRLKRKNNPSTKSRDMSSTEKRDSQSKYKARGYPIRLP